MRLSFFHIFLTFISFTATQKLTLLEDDKDNDNEDNYSHHHVIIEGEADSRFDIIMEVAISKVVGDTLAYSICI